MFVKQLLIGDMAVFCYVLACEAEKKAAVIDPAGDVPDILQVLEDNSFQLEYIINTHFHWDHTWANQELQDKTQAQLLMQEADVPLYGKHVDRPLAGDEELPLGKYSLQLIHTPGHTPGGICIYTQGMLFTGDTLFVGDSGRTDLPYSDRQALGASIRKLMQLPGETVVYPGHDYGPSPSSSLDQEKKHNVNAREYGFYQP
ncbi:MAG: MBL fold metallo-hydrolase [Thermodesulfobacteriota bacterium]